MLSHTDTKTQVSLPGQTGSKLANTARTASGGGTFDQHSLGAKGNSLSSARAIGMQKLIGNKAVAQMLKSSSQSSQPSELTEDIQTDQAELIPLQRRAIIPGVYDSYDSNKARESTKSMFFASNQEDLIIQWVGASKPHIGTIKSFLGNEMVKEKAETGLVSMTEKLGKLTEAKNAAVLAMNLLIEDYKKTAKKPVVSRAKGGSIQDRLRAQVEQNTLMDAPVQSAIKDNVAKVQAEYDKARVLQHEIHTFTTGLQKEASDNKKGKLSYEKMTDAHGKAAGENGLFAMASELGIEVPDSIHALATEANEKAAGKLWIEAGERAANGSLQLESLRGKVTTAAASKKKFEELSADFTLCKQVKQEFDRLKIKDGGDLKLMNDTRLEANAAARNKEWTEAKNKAQMTMQIANKLNSLADQFREYSEGAKPKLLPGTLDTIFKKLGKLPDYTNVDALSYMQDIYEQQCAVKRENWLTYLGIAGGNIVGSSTDHYTTFNDSLPANATFSVFGATKAALCDEMFGIGNEMKRLHSTRVVGATRYHRYWQRVGQGEIYSNNVTDFDLANTNAAAFGALNVRYNEMHVHMMRKVQEAIELHGRIGTNDRAQQLVFP
ncbi:hypothetical protein [Paenibacillus sinopodophylli]|uniref:hypothetical protein n=1 Tax=Paenibacillus sinopodophylli TaxID=1837342 RepID=UPI00110CF596|nr:hypothetical protein [Paenibacillus sinopodophylli]